MTGWPAAAPNPLLATWLSSRARPTGDLWPGPCGRPALVHGEQQPGHIVSRRPEADTRLELEGGKGRSPFALPTPTPYNPTSS